MATEFMTPEVAAWISDQTQLYHMAARESPFREPQIGEPMNAYLTDLFFVDQQAALQLAAMVGVSQEELNAAVQPYAMIPGRSHDWFGKIIGGISEKVIAPVGNTVAENPWLLIAAPLAVYAAAAMVGAGAGSSAGAAATTAGETALAGGEVAATAGGSAAAGGAAWGVTGGIETLTVTAAAPALITPGLAAAASGTVAAALASTELPAAVAAGEVPPPPATTAGSIFTNWAVDTGMGLLSQQVGEALTAKQRKEAEDAMRAAVQQQQNLMGNIPLDYSGVSPELAAAAQAAAKRNQLLLLAAVGAVGVLMVLGD